MKARIRSFDVLAILVGIVLAVPVLGVLFGGIYSLPALWLTKGRDPSYTVLLGVGLSMTVVSIGSAQKLSGTSTFIAWAISLAMLAVRRAFGPLDHNLERFGVIHAMTLVGIMWLLMWTR